jgi:hypothetical protein
VFNRDKKVVSVFVRFSCAASVEWYIYRSALKLQSLQG